MDHDCKPKRMREHELEYIVWLPNLEHGEHHNMAHDNCYSKEMVLTHNPSPQNVVI